MTARDPVLIPIGEKVQGGERLTRTTQASVVESLPGCADCAFQTYCGADPVFHYATQGDPVGHRPTSDFCRRHMAIIRHLFSLLGTEDAELHRILFAWIRERGVPDITAEAAA